MLGGWASRNKYSVISSARVVAQNVAYEIPMFLIVISLVMVTHTFDLRETVPSASGRILELEHLQSPGQPLMPAACLMFFICLLAETNRSPFDMMEAESELIAGAITEYSGMGYGIFFHFRICQYPGGKLSFDHPVSRRVETARSGCIRACTGFSPKYMPSFLS